jgi:hypothetical protein
VAKHIPPETLQRLLSRLQALIILGQSVLGSTAQEEDEVLAGIYHQWRLESHSFLDSVLGLDNRYTVFFNDRVSANFSRRVFVEQGLSSLRGAQSELGFGPLPNVEGLISGTIFTNFLDMAEHLLEQGYTQVVPSLAGAVLEDGLRRIAGAHGIEVREDSDRISSLNQKLADGGIYSNLTRSKIVVWSKIRNNADHGKFAENGEQDVRQMLEGVRDFLSTYLG